MNFIDWDNEFDEVCEAEEAIKAGETEPLYGMDIDTFEAILAEDKYDEYAAIYGVKEKFYEKFPIKVATKESADK